MKKSATPKVNTALFYCFYGKSVLLCYNIYMSLILGERELSWTILKIKSDIT